MARRKKLRPYLPVAGDIAVFEGKRGRLLHPGQEVRVLRECRGQRYTVLAMSDSGPREVLVSMRNLSRPSQLDLFDSRIPS